jgi:two-component sensor histidine kinase
LGIVINELLTNIVKYAYTNGEEKIIALTARKGEKNIVVTLHDNGVGMPENISFENHTGFGLSLVSGLIGGLNGNIRIERGNGTKIVIVFPYEEQA